MPSGWRNSDPTPVPSISGRAPNIAAIVVIRIGRKRSRHAWKIASRGDLPSLALGFEREVDHHDRVLLDDADQEDDADDRDDAEIAAVEHQREQRADARGRQRREDRDRMDVALVEHAEHDIDGDQRGDDQKNLVGERRLKRQRRALEAGNDADRQADFRLGLLDRVDRRAERGAGGEIERHAPPGTARDD